MGNTEDNKIIAEFMGLKQYPKTILWDTDGHSGYQEEEEKDMWVLNPTPVFDEHLRLYRDYYEDIGIERPFDDYFFTLKYHTSWDWIMPVVEKISDLEAFKNEVGFIPKYYFNIYAGAAAEVIVNRKHTELKSPSIVMEWQKGRTLLDTVYSAVIEFIKYYNNQKNGNSKK